MGWKLKALLFLIALFSFAAGGFIIAIPIFAYLTLPPLIRRKKNDGQASQEKTGGGSRPMKYAGILLLVFALIALASGGRFSVLVFGGLGIALIFLAGSHGSGISPSIRPVKDSILLRGLFAPFHWYSVAQVKVATNDVAKALSALNERFLVRFDEKAAAYVVLHASGLRERDAEEKIVDRLREMSKLLAPAGGYLLPLEGEVALPLIKCPARISKLDVRDLDHSLASLPFEFVAVSPGGHLAVAVGAYQKSEGGHNELIVDTKQVLKKPVLVWEIAKSLEKRAAWPGPDDATIFLSSLAATRGANVAERLVQNGQGSGSTLLVRSLRTPEIELSRAQLRALVRAYS